MCWFTLPSMIFKSFVLRPFWFLEIGHCPSEIIFTTASRSPFRNGGACAFSILSWMSLCSCLTCYKHHLALYSFLYWFVNFMILLLDPSCFSFMCFVLWILDPAVSSPPIPLPSYMVTSCSKLVYLFSCWGSVSDTFLPIPESKSLCLFCLGLWFMIA